jgi:TonB family protein
LGPGSGVGLGPGSGGNTGGGVFRVGGGVSAPVLVYKTEPEFSEEARKAKFQGTVVLNVVIGADGRPRDMRIARPLGMGLDEKALEAVKNWRFKPAEKDGHAVAAYASIEVEFNLF